MVLTMEVKLSEYKVLYICQRFYRKQSCTFIIHGGYRLVFAYSVVPYCQISLMVLFQVACTNWKRLMMILSGRTNETNPLNIISHIPHEEGVLTRLSGTHMKVMLICYLQYHICSVQGYVFLCHQISYFSLLIPLPLQVLDENMIQFKPPQNQLSFSLY